ncbi:hypothetical protein HMPREF2787_04725 [Corynebacterium sp. HMSC061H03]|uniref:Rv1157c family protein n=1 Tax=Corynebacterium TaxID=1716 RepID=UPI0008A165E6|nr:MULTISPECIES: hypothetical protein [Corynebacterium]MCQ9167412.1 hypothetical protein [Corynebacterium amycolatum]MCQ9174115.1 hypothetical protein [Corynebacterium amycolatum]MDK8506471.1 hypothetical protein [Corynebacterium amycolatum]OFJ59281.1 hypothetical protein HMPREF2857_00970 [Corynebacterium sp. HMSC076C10]OFK32540.1 hypothetical protein HMPREF2820_05655 [Corynebacterium sp. HMSC064E08]
MVSTGRSFLRRAAATLGAAAILTAGMTPAASASPSLDSLNIASPNLYGNARDIINSPGVPEEISSALNKGIDFLTGEGEGEPGFKVPEGAPKTNQFLLPTVADKCIGGEGRSFGLATTVPGPADLPLPGVPENQLGFIFTGLGTKQLAKQQDTEMNVYWVNVANGKYGKTTLENNGINAEEGPGAVNGTADTGKGVVIAVMQGGITTQEESGATNCNYTPTAGVFPVGLN